MYKKTLIFILNFFVIYISSLFFSELINFLYITPFISAFFFFEALIIYSFYDRNTVIHLSFLFGVISDIISLNKVFVFSALFPLAVFSSEKIFYDLKLEKYPVCVFFYFLYALAMHVIYETPIVVLLFLFVLTYLFCVLLNYVFYKINIQKRVNGEER